MANQDQIMMRNFPPEAELLQMSAEDVGMHLLKYMTRGRAETNLLQMVTGGPIAFRFIEGWGWLVRQGFLALAPNDMYGQNHFVTRALYELASAEADVRTEVERRIAAGGIVSAAGRRSTRSETQPARHAAAHPGSIRPIDPAARPVGGLLQSRPRSSGLSPRRCPKPN
jgi:hypothetical protein